MQRLSPITIAFAGACCLALAVAAMLPPTDLKADWTSLHHPVATAMPPVSYAPVAPAPLDVFPPEGEPARSWPDETAGIDDRKRTDAAEESRIADADAAYGDGYAWAADHALDDGRACRHLSAARREGCRDYVASLAPAAGAIGDQPPG